MTTVNALLFTLGIVLISEMVDYSNADDDLLEQYLGCFYDNRTLWQDGSYRYDFLIADLSIKECIDYCNDTSSSNEQWSYARLQNGSDCRCGNEMGFQIEDSACNTVCAGNTSQYCGGMFHNLVPVYNLYTVCPIGTYGSACDKACHCQHQTPCNRQTGKCPNGCHGNYSGDQCNRITSFSDQYIGCYRDNSINRSMEIGFYNGPLIKQHSDNEPQRCLDLCLHQYSYIGLQFGAECFCGESYKKHGRRQETDCNYNCSGDSSQICGGASAISVYHSCPAGNFGTKCVKVCNCEGRCDFRSGICQSKICKPGWTGKACDIRDCSRNNGDCGDGAICVTISLNMFTTIPVCRCKTGFFRNQTWGRCTDINECSDIPNICGRITHSCSNTEGSFKCCCINRIDMAGSPGNFNQYGAIVGIIIAVIIVLDVLVVSIVILYLVKKKPNVVESRNAATSTNEDILLETRNAVQAVNCTNPSFEDAEYTTLSDKTADDNRLYAVLDAKDYVNTEEICDRSNH